MSEFHTFLPICKIDEERRLVSGYASTEAEDSDGEIIELSAIKAALPDYLEYGNIREMHALKAVGVAAETNLDKKGLYLTAHIADDAAWKKCLPSKLPDGTVLPPVYKGFSVGGRKLSKKGNRIKELELNEISVVDRPANPECKIDIAKAKKEAEGAGGYLIPLSKVKLTPEQKALKKVAKALAKAGPPAARDGFSLPAPTTKTTPLNDPKAPRNIATRPNTGGVPSKEPDSTPSVNDTETSANATRKADDDNVACEQHGKIGCKKCAIVKRMSTKCAAHGALGCAKCAYKKKAKGKPLAAEGVVPQVEKNKEKAVGTFNLRKTKAADLPEFLELRKGMGTGGSLSYVFDSIRNAQRSLMLEGHREGGDKKDHALAARLGAVAKELASVIGQKALHEGDEATDMSDADDHYVNHTLKRAKNMDDDGESLLNRAAAGGDPLGLAILDMVKRASAPTRMQRMAKAVDQMKEARKAAKSARAAIEECHKMHKAAFLAKVEKAKKAKDKDDEDEGFDHAGAMEKLQKAYADLDKSRILGKAAMGQLAKAAGRSGQRGQEVGDSDPGFYEVPMGVKDLSPKDLATASPGGDGRGSEPPMYPADGSVYAGKAAGAADDGNILRKYARKDGSIPADIAEILMKQAAANAELESLRQLSRGAVGGTRPYAFDTGKVFGTGAGAAGQDLNKALFAGVDVNAIGSGDEMRHTAASAKVIGNFLTSGRFAKSVLDPEFKGAAGN